MTALAIAEELGEADDLNRAYMGLSALLVETGRPEEGIALVFDAAAVGEDVWGLRLKWRGGERDRNPHPARPL